ncbi:hypothetical protein CS022_03275 [Veronia nyctiphanis]|uniref:EAL domain-containing protein n=1 Tax=Veronia nyctiphanis TaxID=1278244 RepID=A0A4Q0YUV4_9GAMM|nr:EAL domain-containing protein [Veronia nyctiphanis]RXJ74603.1 hypothetical protein CS022_03275 [Veronia nyctiphanis]
MQEQLNQQKTLEQSLRKAINNNELDIHFQPQVDMQTLQLIGVEALVRWKSEHGAYISPKKIIEVAEQTGLMQHLGHWIIDRALADFSYMLDQRCAPGKMSINLSGKEFHNGYLADYILQTIRRYDIPPSRVQIELTEQTFIENIEENRDTLNRLTLAGISVAIDDFGTGYSSLAYLKHYPVDSIKIDKSFISDLPKSKDDLIICQTMVSMANLLSLKVIAEGVETLDQHEVLKNIGCSYGQGQHYFNVMKTDDILSIVKEQKAGRVYPGF